MGPPLDVGVSFKTPCLGQTLFSVSLAASPAIKLGAQRPPVLADVMKFWCSLASLDPGL